MKNIRKFTLIALFGIGVGAIVSGDASAQPIRPPAPGGRRPVAPRVVVRPPVPKPRVPVVVNPGWPLKRPPRSVVVRPPPVVVRPRIQPRLYLPPVVFGGVVVVERYGYPYGREYGYSRESLAWQDSVTLYREDDWVEFTLDCNARGSKLWFEVHEGRLQVDWAEVVFQNGEVQVVEFPERSLSRGIYQLLDFRDGRRVEYVRMVARATSGEAQLGLWLQR
jgi:hypothetical protein